MIIMALFDNLDLKDINFNIETELQELQNLQEFTPFIDEQLEDEEYEEYLEKEMQKRLNELNIKEKPEQDEKEKKQLIEELFGEDSEEQEDVEPQIENIKETLMELVRDNGFGESVDKKTLLGKLNDDLETDEQFELSSSEMSIKPEEDKIIQEYIAKVEEDRKLYPLEQKMESEDKIVSSSFDEKLERVKDEIQKINKRGKKEKSKKEKECPEGKEKNPLTGKCVIKCKDGYKRNKDTFKCEKEKQEKNKQDSKKQNQSEREKETKKRSSKDTPKQIELKDDYYEFTDGKTFNWVIINDYLGYNEEDRQKLKDKEDIVMFDKSITVKVPADRYGEKPERAVKITKPVTVKNFIQTINNFYKEKNLMEKMRGLVYYEGIIKGDDDKLHLMLGS